MESRIIKFRLIHKGKIFGYEKLTENGWESMAPFLNPEGGERWTPVVFPNSIEGVRQQYTGLNDKNGKEIYEGDLLNFTFDGVIFVSNPYYVVFEGGAFVVNKPNFKPLVSDCEFIEVVGNLYDNPELLNP